MAEDKGYAELKLIGGEILLLDKEDYDRLPHRDKWRVYMSKDKQYVGRWSDEKGKGTTTYVSALLFEYDRKRQKIVFRNGDRLDYRRENIEYTSRRGQTGQKNVAAFLMRRNNHANEIFVNGCILTKANLGKRCADFLNCSHYDKCLDEVCDKTEWPGWTATCAKDADMPRRKLKLEANG